MMTMMTTTPDKRSTIQWKSTRPNKTMEIYAKHYGESKTQFLRNNTGLRPYIKSLQTAFSHSLFKSSSSFYAFTINVINFLRTTQKIHLGLFSFEGHIILVFSVE